MKKNCFICNKEFVTYPSRIKKGEGKYCSLKCSLINMHNVVRGSDNCVYLVIQNYTMQNEKK